jgi:dUTP pyrophosphatase
MGPKVKLKFTSQEAKRWGLPKYAYEGDAGFDLRVVLPEDQIKDGLTIFPGERVLISCGIAIQMEKGWWARITHRSSTEKKLRLRVVEGTIDEGYTGEIFTQVHNPNTFSLNIKHGDRLAQMIFHRLHQAEFEEVDELGTTDRGANGFGSSGKA